MVVYKTPLVLWVMLDFINIINFSLDNNLATFAACNSFIILSWMVDIINLLQRNSDLSIRHSWIVNLDLGFLDRFV
jgi:hypothetical protein